MTDKQGKTCEVEQVSIKKDTETKTKTSPSKSKASKAKTPTLVEVLKAATNFVNKDEAKAIEENKVEVLLDLESSIREDAKVINSTVHSGDFDKATAHVMFVAAKCLSLLAVLEGEEETAHNLSLVLTESDVDSEV